MLTLFNIIEYYLSSLNIICFTLTLIVKGLWLNSEQATQDEVIKKLSMELPVQILPALEAKRYERLRRIIANAGNVTGKRQCG